MSIKLCKRLKLFFSIRGIVIFLTNSEVRLALTVTFYLDSESDFCQLRLGAFNINASLSCSRDTNRHFYCNWSLLTTLL